MSDQGVWLHARAAGWDLLLDARDLREVMEPAGVSAIPGGPRGIMGVVIYHGEFLPVLSWEQLPGARPGVEGPMALAVLKPRLGLPLERILGTLAPSSGAWRDPEEEGAPPWCGGICRLDGVDLYALDPDRLIALLHRLREER